MTSRTLNVRPYSSYFFDTASPGLTGTANSLDYRIAKIEESQFTAEYWYGKLGSQTTTEWADENSLAPYRAISGDGDFGGDANDEAQVVGSADMASPVECFRLHEVMISAASVTSPYIVRVVWGTGTMSAAINAGQYSAMMFDVAAASRSIPVPFLMPDVVAGTKIWAQVKNATNNATADFFVGLCYYDGS